MSTLNRLNQVIFENKNPELALEPKIAAKIMVEGMTKGASIVGDFTGKCLEQFFTPTLENPKGARTIINGTDKAKEIADKIE